MAEKKKSLKQLEKQYKEMFGGYPYFLLMGADDDYIMEKLSECIESGKPLEAEDDAVF